LKWSKELFSTHIQVDIILLPLGHKNLIHDICWSEEDKDKDVPIQYLLTASADFSVKLWSVPLV
jgi:hypothetical protein